MAEKSEAPGGRGTAGHSAEAVEFLHSFGLVFRHSTVYGQSHSVTQDTMRRSFELLCKVLAGQEMINFAFTEKELLLDRAPVENPTPATRSFFDQIATLEIASFSFDRGITFEEFGNVIELLHSSPEEMRAAGGFPEVVKTLGLPHVLATRVIFKQITEDEMIISKKKLEEAVDPGDMEQLVAALQGGAERDPEKVAVQLQSLASDSQKLTGIVMEAAGMPEGASNEERAGKVVECIKHFYEHVSKSPLAKTQKGKKELIKTLQEVEEGVLRALREKTGAGSAEAVAKISDGVDQLLDELQIDSLAAEYAKKHRAIETSETRILRYMKSMGDEVLKDTSLKEKLLSSGVSPEAWEGLLAKSGIALSQGDAGVVIAAGTLAGLLADLQSKLAALKKEEGGGTGEAAREVGGMVARVAGEVANIADMAEQKIAAFMEKLKEPLCDEKELGLTRKVILEFLAEIVQELRQPLAVVTSAIDALKLGMLGQVTAAQAEMLSLAASSSARLDHLIDKLLEISGLPGELEPDAKILGAVYETDGRS